MRTKKSLIDKTSIDSDSQTKPVSEMQQTSTSRIEMNPIEIHTKYSPEEYEFVPAF